MGKRGLPPSNEDFRHAEGTSQIDQIVNIDDEIGDEIHDVANFVVKFATKFTTKLATS